MYAWAVVKDPGGTAGLLPIVSMLRTRGHEVTLFTNGKASELLKGKEDSVQFTEDMLPDMLAFKSFKKPQVLLTSMCSQGGIGRDLVMHLRGKVPTVAVQDFWGARLWTDWADPKFRPDYIVVNDKVGQGIVRDAWPEFGSDRVIASGFPALDKYFGYDREKENVRVREALGIPMDTSIVLFGGQGGTTGHALGELVECLNLGVMWHYPALIARPHPRTKDNFQGEMKPWQDSLAKLTGATLVVDFFNQVDGQGLIAAADVVVSMYSTMLIEAAALRRHNISILYPDVHLKRFREETGGLKEFPLTELGCSAKAMSRSELQDELETALTGRESYLLDAQEKRIRVDGKNALRAAEFIEKLAN